MSQAPARLGGSYRSYKIDTENVKSWISTTASTNQYPGAPASQSKEAVGKKQVVSTAELLRQAQFLANIGPPKVKVDLSIQKALQSAIAIRQNFYQYYKQRADTSPAVGASNTRHRYFIEVFERIVVLLRPSFKKDIDNDGSGPASVAALRNNFQELGVEEVDEEAQEGWASAPLPESQIPAGDLCELDSKSDELLFELHCYFRDLHAYREYIKGLSSKFCDGKLDLITFSLACDIIVSIVGDMTVSLVSDYPQHINKTNSFNDMRRIISVEDCPGDNINGKAEEELRKLTFAEAYDLISKFDFSNKETYGSRLAKIISDETKVSKSQTLISNFLLDTFEDAPKDTTEAKDTPEDIPEIPLLTYTPATDAATKSFEDLFKKPSKKAKKKAHGESSSISTAFNAQILLDINNVMGDKVSRGYEKLRILGALAENILGIGWDNDRYPHKEYTRQHITPTPKELTSIWPFPDGSRLATDTSHLINSIIKHPDVVSLKQAKLMKHLQTRTLPRPNDTPSQAADISQAHTPTFSFDPTFTLKSNPVYCGKEALRLELEMENLGIELVKSYACPSLIATAHLYNAALQGGYLKGTWGALDRAIQEHIEPLFLGGLPTTPKEMLNRCSLLVLPPNIVGGKHRPLQRSDFKYSGTKSRAMMERNTHSEHLENYISGADSAERLLHNFYPKDKDRAAQTERVTHLEMIKYFINKLPLILDKIETDYISLNRLSGKLLDRIYAKLSSDEHKQWEANYGTMELKSQPLLLVNLILQNYTMVKAHGASYNRAVTYVGSRFLAAVEILNDFLEEANQVVHVEPFDVVKETRDEKLARSFAAPDC